MPSSPVSPAVRAALASTGTLRAAINLGNPVLAARDATSGEAVGVSVDLARALAQQLDVPVEWMLFDKAAQSVEAVRAGAADVGFLAVDPARSEGLRFSAPYVLIEGSYLVPQASPLRDNAQVDAPGQRIAVGQGSAYDLYLTRAIGQAAIARVANAPAVLAAVKSGQVEVAAGIRTLLAEWAAHDAGLRLLPGRFMVIEQAMGLPAGKGDAAGALLAGFVEAMKANGFVAEALARHKVQGAIVAPAA